MIVFICEAPGVVMGKRCFPCTADAGRHWRDRSAPRLGENAAQLIRRAVPPDDFAGLPPSLRQRVGKIGVTARPFSTIRDQRPNSVVERNRSEQKCGKTHRQTG